MVRYCYNHQKVLGDLKKAGIGVGLVGLVLSATSLILRDNSGAISQTTLDTINKIGDAAPKSIGGLLIAGGSLMYYKAKTQLEDIFYQVRKPSE